MTSTLHLMYKELEKCTQSLEEDVKRSLDEINSANTFNENMVALQSSKDYHFKEILNQLKQIKQHIKIIADHNQSIELLQNKINGSRIDKDYIKRQVETFQKISAVNRREHKPTRPRETSSSFKLLECWDKMMEEEQEKENSDGIPTVPKKPNNVEKFKKRLSSTVDSFLESPSDRNVPSDCFIEENAENIAIVNEEVASTVLKDANAEALNRNETTDNTQLPTGDNEKQESLNDIQIIEECLSQNETESDTQNVLENANGENLSVEGAKLDDLLPIINDLGQESVNEVVRSAECLNHGEKEADTQSTIIEGADQESSSEEEEDTKPRIIEVIYKKNINAS